MEARKSKIKMLANMVSEASPLPVLHTAAFLPGPPMVELDLGPSNRDRMSSWALPHDLLSTQLPPEGAASQCRHGGG